MLYRELKPPPALQDAVRCLWILEDEPGPNPVPEKVVPDGCVELLFQLGAPYRTLVPGSEACEAPQPRSLVIGQIRRFIEIVPTGRVELIGVRLEPTALHRLLGVAMNELTDREVSLEELGRPDLLELEGRLHEARTWPTRVRLLSAWLEGALPTRGCEASAAVTHLRRSHGLAELGRVARAVGVSTRTLDRRFRDRVGLSPKVYARQLRLQRAFELLGRSPGANLAEVALASGCYDQAHLNREFRDFAGESPAAFLRARHELSGHLTGLA